MIDILRGKNIWCVINGVSKKPTIAIKELVMWEELCEHARGLVEQTILDSLHVHIEAREESQQETF